MRDDTGRNINYLRLSITDRCNLRCAYCMPPGGVDALSHPDIMTFEETERLVGIAARTGISRVKITGGEPLARKGAAGLMRAVKSLPGIEQVTLTTNGVALRRHLDEITDAGVDGVNISIDTLDPENYKRLTGFDRLGLVLESVRAAADVLPVKVNAVPIAGVNDGELCDLAAMAEREVAAVRFIELMPVGLARRFEYMDTSEVKRAIETRFGSLSPCAKSIGNGPAEYFRPPGFSGLVGFIHAMSGAFCDSCNRVRITADGRFMPCLGRPDYVDMKGMMREGMSDGELFEIMKRAIRAKPARHGFADPPAADAAQGRGMNAIGG
jgi:cyclic pyranopterin phosphate synthase